MKDKIERIKEIAKGSCPKDRLESEFYGHVVLVVKNSKLLAKKLGAEMEIVEIASWLHDIARWKNTEDHHIKGAEEAEKIMRNLGYSRDMIDKVKHCIFSHRGSLNIKRNTVEAECVASGDAMSHFDNVSFLFYHSYGFRSRNYIEGNKWVVDHLKRSWKKMNPEAKKIMRNKYLAIKELFL